MFTIETERLRIKEYEDTNILELHQILSNPITMGFWPAPFTMQQTENWITKNILRYKEIGFGRWPIFLKETNNIIGDCGIVIAEVDGKEVYDLGYIIHHPYWSNGFAFEAADACKTYAFHDLHLKKIYANMPHNHDGSRKTAEKIGMLKEKEFFNTRNRNILTYLYSISSISTGSQSN